MHHQMVHHHHGMQCNALHPVRRLFHSNTVSATAATEDEKSAESSIHGEQVVGDHLRPFFHDDAGILHMVLSREGQLSEIQQRMDHIREHVLFESGDPIDRQPLVDLHLVCKTFDESDREGKVNRLELYKEIFGTQQTASMFTGNRRRLVILWRQWVSEDMNTAKEDEENGYVDPIDAVSVELLGSPDVEFSIANNEYWKEGVCKGEVAEMLENGEYSAALIRVLRFLEGEFRLNKREWRKYL